jgi:single-strand DNA-binding protein
MSMASFNKIIIVGNLTKDPELKPVGSGSVCRLSIASNRQFKNRQTGAVSQEVCYVDIDVWGAQAESSHQHLRKGRSVLVEGRLKYDAWKDAEGNNRYRHSITADRIIFLGNRPEESENGEERKLNFEGGLPPLPAAAPVQARKSKKSQDNSQFTEFKDEQPFDDDLPF